jgi:hypothetical protein
MKKKAKGPRSYDYTFATQMHQARALLKLLALKACE